MNFQLTESINEEELHFKKVFSSLQDLADYIIDDLSDYPGMNRVSYSIDRTDLPCNYTHEFLPKDYNGTY